MQRPAQQQIDMDPRSGPDRRSCARVCVCVCVCVFSANLACLRIYFSGGGAIKKSVWGGGGAASAGQMCIRVDVGGAKRQPRSSLMWVKRGNSLTDDIKESTNLVIFKKKFKDMTLEKNRSISIDEAS